MASVPDKGPRAIAISIIFTVLAGIFVIGRCVARFGLVRNAGPDDYLMICALLCSIVMTVLLWDQQIHGLGRHFADLKPGEFTKMGKGFWIDIPIYNLVLTFTKLSILLQYMRVFSVGRSIRRACWTMLVVIVLFGVSSVITGIFTCTPISYFWNRTIEGHCINEAAFWFTNAAINIITDIILWAMPLPVLNSLQLPSRQKYGLMIVFAIGGFVVITSILRLHSLYVAVHATDVTWQNIGVGEWSAVEVNVGIVCACLPTLRPVLGRIFPSILASSHVVSHTGGPSARRNTIHTKGTVKSNVTGTHKGFEEFRLGDMDTERADGRGHGQGDDNNAKNIKVTTTFAQEVERRDSDTDSDERKLVWGLSERERASERSF